LDYCPRTRWRNGLERIHGIRYDLLVDSPYDQRIPLFSTKLAHVHFWIGTLGIIIYTLPMYVAGFTQASMWNQFNPDGTLTYGNFLETVQQIIPMYWMRAIGGTMYIIGMFILVYNIIRTVMANAAIADEAAEAPALEPITTGRIKGEKFHPWLERRPIQLTILATVAILIGGIIQIVPTIMVKSNIPTIASVKPYTPLELEGRDLYIREGCVGCHSQMVRPFRSEVERYAASQSRRIVYDHPFLWGSKRTVLICFAWAENTTTTGISTICGIRNQPLPDQSCRVTNGCSTTRHSIFLTSPVK
jgi:cytochrome c oxidase cbb3-type subunit I/II